MPDKFFGLGFDRDQTFLVQGKICALRTGIYKMGNYPDLSKDLQDAVDALTRAENTLIQIRNNLPYRP